MPDTNHPLSPAQRTDLARYVQQELGDNWSDDETMALLKELTDGLSTQIFKREESSGELLIDPEGLESLLGRIQSAINH